MRFFPFKCPSIFRLICRHFNDSPILCPINATSSSSYVFRLQYPRVLHCRIVLNEKLKTLLALERNPVNVFQYGGILEYIKLYKLINMEEYAEYLQVNVSIKDIMVVQCK